MFLTRSSSSFRSGLSPKIHSIEHLIHLIVIAHIKRFDVDNSIDSNSIRTQFIFVVDIAIRLG